MKQECIPVGCVLAAHWPYAAVFFRGGVCLVWGCAWSQGGVPGLGWGSAWSRGGSPCRWGFSLPGGPARRTPLVNRITDTCKNITLATTSLRPLMIGIWQRFQRNFELTVFELTVPDLYHKIIQFKIPLKWIHNFITSSHNLLIFAKAQPFSW